jgi:AraC-type transcriptional regulator N-terminus
LKPTDNNPPPSQADALLAPSEADLRKLAVLVSAHAPSDGRFELHVPGVSAVRFSQSSPHLVHAVVGPVLCVVAQGAKSVMLGPEVYEYDASRMLIFSVDLPVSGQVTRASRA